MYSSLAKSAQLHLQYGTNPPVSKQQVIYSMPMISLEDARWSNMIGGYRLPFDPRPLLKRLDSDQDKIEVWHELWNELHHQGDVGDASFAAVPFLVESYIQRGMRDWNTFAIVAIIELARKEGKNEDVPRWLADDYFEAIGKLAAKAAAEVLQAESPDEVRAMLSMIAIAKSLRVYGKLLINYAEDELLDIAPSI